MKVNRRVRDISVFTLYRLGSQILRLVPPTLAGVFSIIGGVAAFLFAPRKRRIVADNQRRAFQVNSTNYRTIYSALRAYISYARYWIEALSIGNLNNADLNARVSFYGLENLYQVLGEGKGAIITSPHLGNWDFGAAWFAAKGNPITAVMEDLEPKEVLEWFANHRKSFGVTAIPASANSFVELAKCISRGEIVALVADRDLLNSGVEVSFFGEITSLPQGVALLALRTGSPIIPTAVYMLPKGFHFAVTQPPIYVERRGRMRDDVQRVSEEIVEAFERFIGADPAQWHLFQRNWPSQSESFQR